MSKTEGTKEQGRKCGDLNRRSQRKMRTRMNSQASTKRVESGANKFVALVKPLLDRFPLPHNGKKDTAVPVAKRWHKAHGHGHLWRGKSESTIGRSFSGISR